MLIISSTLSHWGPAKKARPVITGSQFDKAISATLNL